MENININDTLDEIGLDIECIIKEIISIVLDPERRKTDHETISILFVLFAEKSRKFTEYFNQYMWMKTNAEYIKSLELRNTFEDERLESIKDALLGVYNVLIKYKSQTEQLLQSSVKPQPFECDMIVRCAQLFSQVYSESKTDEKDVIKFYPSPKEIFKSKVYITGMNRSIIPGTGMPMYPFPMTFPPYPTVPIKNTLGYSLHKEKVQPKPMKKKKSQSRSKSGDKKTKFSDPASPPLTLFFDPPRPKIKCIKETKWNEEKALSLYWSVDLNMQIKPETEYDCEVECPDTIQVPNERRIRYIPKVMKNAEVNKYLDKIDPPEPELFPDEERLNFEIPGADELVVDDADEEEANMEWHKNKYLENFKSMNPPEKDPLVFSKNYRKARYLCSVRPKAKLLQSRYFEPVSGPWQPKYGRFDNKHCYRRPHLVSSTYEFPHIRRPPDQPLPELDPSERLWNFRKWNNSDPQLQQNL